MQLSQVITHWSAVLRLPQLAPEPDGGYGLRVGEIDIRLVPQPLSESAFVARACLGVVDVPDFAPLLERLLRENFFAGGVGGATLGLDAEARVFLTQHFDQGRLSLAAIDAWLARFVAQARQVRQMLDLARASQASQTPAQGVSA